MQFTEQDRQALYNIWMSQKAKMRITQMEMAKKMQVSPVEFTNALRGSHPLSLGFINNLCGQLHVDPASILPSMKQRPEQANSSRIVTTKIGIDGEIQNAYIEGNQVIIEYRLPTEH
jgi:transcriptional regulator with XRE-family HTH domain